MSYNLLELVQQVTAELNLAVPTYVIGNPSQDTQQILALMNRAGYDLIKEYNWQALELEYRFYTNAITTTCNTVAGTQTLTAIPSTTGLDNTYSIVGGAIPQDTYVDTVLSSTSLTTTQQSSTTTTGGSVTFSKTIYPLPSDYETITDNTHWDKTKHWQMLGPVDAQQWQWLKSGYISTGPRVRWRILGNTFQIWPPYNTQEYLGFEYRSRGFVRSATNAVLNSFQADTDTTVLDNTVMVLATKLKYFQIKSFDTTSLQQDYMRYLSIAKANDKGSATLSFAPMPSAVLIGWANVPDTGYGS
jgi:hypothetical protein